MQAIQRQFFPGSKWLFIKIYCGRLTADELLFKIYDQLVLPHQEQQFIEKFFFIRYHDPEFHLRLRLELNNPLQSGMILEQINGLLALEHLLVHKIQIDTYERELERYTPALIQAVETFFHMDTAFCMQLLPQAFSDTEKIILASKSFLIMMESFRLPPSQQLILVRGIKNKYAQLFSLSVSSKKDLSRKISVIFRQMQYNPPETPNFLNDFRNDCAAWYIHHHTEIGDGDKLLYDLFHMQVNRLFTGNQRMYEYLSYHCIYREIAKNQALVE